MLLVEELDLEKQKGMVGRCILLWGASAQLDQL